MSLGEIGVVMTPWTHAICDHCYSIRYDVTPVRVKPETETCCFCGKDTRSGIYVRQDPDLTPCGGKHGQSERRPLRG